MTKPNPHLWPKGATLIVHDQYGEICRSTDRRFDLADAIMLPSPTDQKTVTLSIMTDDEATDETVSRLEDLIRYDFAHDGYTVTLSQQEAMDISIPYVWKVRIRTL